MIFCWKCVSKRLKKSLRTYAAWVPLILALWLSLIHDSSFLPHCLILGIWANLVWEFVWSRYSRCQVCDIRRLFWIFLCKRHIFWMGNFRDGRIFWCCRIFCEPRFQNLNNFQSCTNCPQNRWKCRFFEFPMENGLYVIRTDGDTMFFCWICV